MARPDRRKSKAKKSNHSQRMNQLKAKALTKVAEQAWGYNQRYKTISLLTEALRRDPANPDIILNLAIACGKQRHYERAEELLSRLLELAPRKASIHRRVGPDVCDDRSAGTSRRVLPPSLELNRDISATVPTLLELAALYERRHQLDEARAVVAEAITREPDNEEAQLQQAVLDRRRQMRLARRPACATWSRMTRAFGPSAPRRGTSWLNCSTTPSGTTRRFKSCWLPSGSFRPTLRPPVRKTRRRCEKTSSSLQSLDKSHYRALARAR